MTEVSTLRLYLLRTLYLLIFVGQSSIQWPAIMHHATTLPFWHGIGSSMLFALALVSALGVRYPLQMLPVLLFELLWKAVWLLAIALPLWLANQMDADTAESAPSILAGLVVPIIIPWRYVFSNYLRKPGDKWK